MLTNEKQPRIFPGFLERLTCSSSSDSSSSNPSNPGTVTDASAEKIAKLQKDLEDAKAALAAALKAVEKAGADEKAAAEKAVKDAQDAQKAAEQALEDYKNAQGDRDADVQNVAARFGNLDENVVTVAAGNAGAEIKASIPVVSLKAIENKSQEAILMRNVWYDYTNGKFMTMVDNTGEYSESILYVKDETKYAFIDTRLPENERFLKKNWLKAKKASETYLQLYKINGLDDEKNKPYVVKITGRNVAGDEEFPLVDIYPDVLATIKETVPYANGTNDNGREITDGAGDYVAYTSPEGVKKLIVFGNEDYAALPSGLCKDGFSILENVDGVYKENYITKVDYDESIGFNPKYFVKGEDGKWYVVVNERTTYHDQKGNWLYRIDNYGNPLYNWQGIWQNGTYTKDYDGVQDLFVRFNTSAEFTNYVDSPYLRVDPDGIQYSTKYVAVDKVNAPKENKDHKIYEPVDSVDRGLAIQEKYIVREDEANRDSYDVVSYPDNSVTGNSIGREYLAFADASTAVATKDKALVNAWILQHVYGGEEKAIVYYNSWNKVAYKDADGTEHLYKEDYYSNDSFKPTVELIHANEYYVLGQAREGYVALLSDPWGYAVEFVGFDGAGVPQFDRVIGELYNEDGTLKAPAEVDYDDVRVREFGYTRDYKVACSQNTIHFSYAKATNQWYVEPEYEGSVELFDGTPAAFDTDAIYSDEVNHVSKSNDKTDRWNQFNEVKVKLHPTYDGYDDETWAGETGFEVQKSEYDGLLTKTIKPEFKDYVYVHVKAVYSYDKNYDNGDGTFGAYVADASFVPDRWYKKVTNDRKDDLLYDKDSYSFEKTEDEATGAKLIEGGYGAGKYVEVSVEKLGEAFDLAQNEYGIFGIVQAKENGRFYKVRK